MARNKPALDETDAEGRLLEFLGSADYRPIPQRELLHRMNQLASGGLQPDLTLLLDCAPATALSRARRRTEEQSPGGSRGDRFESQNLEFHERVRGGFLEIARAEPKRIVVLDTSATAEEVHEKIKKIVDDRLGGLSTE